MTQPQPQNQTQDQPAHKVLFDDVAMLAALDAQRSERGMSWRAVAAEAGVSPSLLSRLGRGHHPDVNSVLTLCAWLNTPVEHFAGYDGRPNPGTKASPSLLAQVVPLLRAELSQTDANYVEEILRVTLKYIRKTR